MNIKMVLKNIVDWKDVWMLYDTELKRIFQWQCSVLVVGVSFQNWALCQIYVLEYKKIVLRLSMKMLFFFFLTKN